MEIRRPKLLLPNVVVLLVVAVIVGLSWNYYQNFFFGPYPLNDDALLALAEAPGNANLLVYGELKDRQLFDTLWQEAVFKGDKQQYSNPLFYMFVGDRVMLVQATRAEDGQHLVGPISRGHSSLEDEVIADVEAAHPELRGRFLPIRMNALAAFNVIGYIGLAILIPVTALAAVNIARSV